MRRVILFALLVLMPAAGRAGMKPLPRAQSDYLLGCGGCHGFDGVTNSKLVPDLKGQVGYFLNLRQGRQYLARLPNVAFSTLSDRALAEMLNYVVFTLGGDSVPKGAKPFTASEVGTLRQKPLTEVKLFQYREGMVETLIKKYNATARLRLYGDDMYESGY